MYYEALNQPANHRNSRATIEIISGRRESHRQLFDTPPSSTMDGQQFVRLLQSLLEPNTDVVRKSTTELKKYTCPPEARKSSILTMKSRNYYTHPQALTALIQICISHDSADLRQLAAVEARKLVPKHWSSIPAPQKTEIRNQLLKATLEEDAQLVQHSIARIITSIATIDFENDEWTDLPGLLMQAAASSNAKQRAVSLYIIYVLLETLGEFFVENFHVLFRLFEKTIRDPESEDARMNTLIILGKVAMLIDTEEDNESLEAFQELVPSMVAVLKDAIVQDKEGPAMQAFETFQSLLGCDSALLAKHFGDLVKFMIEVSSQKEIDGECRSQALAFLMQCVRYRKLKIQGLRIGEELTLKSLQIVTELGDLQSDDDEITPARSALGLLDILASGLPPSQVVVPLLKALGQYVTNDDPDYRRAGILALGMCVEGAPDFIETQLKEILPLVLHLLEDPNIRVRSAALNCVARLSDDLAEDVAKDHAKLIPAMVKNYDIAIQIGRDQNDQKELALEVIRGSCNAIDSLIEGLDKTDAAIYIPELVPRFSQLINSDDIKIQSGAIAAVGSIAAAAGDAFMPYFEGIMQKLGQFITIKDTPDELDLRGVATDALGKIASAVGAEPFKPFVQPLMQASEEALHLDHPRLRECSYILWSTMAKVYEENFAEYLDGAVKGLKECLEQEEEDLTIELGDEAFDLVGSEVMIAGKKVKVEKSKEGENDDDEFEDIDDDDEEDELTAITAVAMEKEIAVEVIGDLLRNTRRKYLPYLQESVDMVLKLVEHSFEGVRKGAITTLWVAYTVLYGLAEGDGMARWKPGFPLQVEPPPEIKKLGDVVMRATLDAWEDEIDRYVTTSRNSPLTRCFTKMTRLRYTQLTQTHMRLLRKRTDNLIKIAQFAALDIHVLLIPVPNAARRNAVTEINRNLSSNLRVCGPAILFNNEKQQLQVQEVATILLAIITKRHQCQQDLGDDEAEVDEALLQESSEYDWLVVDTAMEVLIGLSAALGQSFSELWKMFEKPVLKYASSQEATERSTAIGTIAECIGNMGKGCTPYSSSLMKVILHRIGDEDVDVKSNAVYAAGLLCQMSEDEKEILSNYNTILTKLEPMLDAGQNGRLLDNAAGCVSRMISKHPDKVPLQLVLPALVDILPAREDYEENKPVFDCIVSLCMSRR